MQVELPPWMEKMQQPKALAAGAGLILVLVLALIFTAWRWGIAGDRYELLEKRVGEGFLQAPSSTRTVRINARDSGLIGIDGGGMPQRIDLVIGVQTDRYDRFRVSLVRDDGTLLFHADRLIRDSNSELKLSLNSSMLPNGRYRIRIEGYPRTGEMQRFAEVLMQVSGR